jgi:hypothetical protein
MNDALTPVSAISLACCAHPDEFLYFLFSPVLVQRALAVDQPSI